MVTRGTVTCINGHVIVIRPIVGSNIPTLVCWACVAGNK